MRPSFVLGIFGGIIAFIVGLLEYIIGTAYIAFNFNSTSSGVEYLLIVSFIAGILGIVGGAIGMKKGGVLMIIGGAS